MDNDLEQKLRNFQSKFIEGSVEYNLIEQVITGNLSLNDMIFKLQIISSKIPNIEIQKIYEDIINDLRIQINKQYKDVNENVTIVKDKLEERIDNKNFDLKKIDENNQNKVETISSSIKQLKEVEYILNQEKEVGKEFGKAFKDESIRQVFGEGLEDANVIAEKNIMYLDPNPTPDKVNNWIDFYQKNTPVGAHLNITICKDNNNEDGRTIEIYYSGNNVTEQYPKVIIPYTASYCDTFENDDMDQILTKCTEESKVKDEDGIYDEETKTQINELANDDEIKFENFDEDDETLDKAKHSLNKKELTRYRFDENNRNNIGSINIFIYIIIFSLTLLIITYLLLK